MGIFHTKSCRGGAAWPYSGRSRSASLINLKNVDPDGPQES